MISRRRIPTLHRQVLTRLALAWAILSVVFGVGAYFLEMRKVDARMLELALARSSLFVGHVGRIGIEGEDHLEELRRAAKATLASGFTSVRVYDAGQRPILEAVDSRPARSRPDPGRHVHPLSRGDAPHYHTHWTDGRRYMQVLLPIESGGTLRGYFEGVYEVDAAMARAMTGHVAAAVALVVVVVFATATALYPIIILLNRGLAARSAALLQSNVELMEVLGSAIAKRDCETHLHNYRVTLYAVRIAEAIALPEPEFRRLIAGAFLHDVGKIGIADGILRKPGALTAEELAVMRTHVTLGVDIISRAEWLESARDVVACHHERFDGGGYPRGLRGDSIPLVARIFAVADVFDALTCRRCYKEAMSLESACAVMRAERGSHFDPRIIGAFDEMARDLYQEIGAAEEAELSTLLRGLVARYFCGRPGFSVGF